MTDSEPADQIEEYRAPRWLSEMRNNGSAIDHFDRPRGFYYNYKHFGAVHVARSDDILIVAFDNLSSVNDESLEREAWGDALYAQNGWSSLGIISFSPNWYRDKTLFQFLEDLRDQGFFNRFRKVVFTGTSMGGYAACAFSSLVPGSTVIAYSPQSTLSKQLVPWEKRFNRGRKQDWSEKFVDGANLIAKAERVYLCYDPYMKDDKAHIDRFSGGNIVHLKSNYSGHKSVVFLRRIGILKEVTTQCVTGEMTPAVFAKMYRSRRNLPWYFFELMDMALERGHLELSKKIIENAGEFAQSPNIRRALRKNRRLYMRNNSGNVG